MNMLCKEGVFRYVRWHQWWANLKSNLSLKSQIFFTGDLNLQAKYQILNRISHQNLESSNSKSQIKSQIPKQQKGFSKHISILLVISQSVSTYWRKFVNVSSEAVIKHETVIYVIYALNLHRVQWKIWLSSEYWEWVFNFNHDFEISVKIACLLNRIVKIWIESVSNRMVLESNRAMFESNLRCKSNRDWI